MGENNLAVGLWREVAVAAKFMQVLVSGES